MQILKCDKKDATDSSAINTPSPPPIMYNGEIWEKVFSDFFYQNLNFV